MKKDEENAPDVFFIFFLWLRREPLGFAQIIFNTDGLPYGGK